MMTAFPLSSITEGARKMLETDPHGWILTVVAIVVVFSCLLILYGVYSLSGYLFTKSAGGKRTSDKAPKHNGASGPDDTESELAAVIALSMYLDECTHDVESGIITICNGPNSWGGKQRNFRRLPERRK